MSPESAVSLPWRGIFRSLFFEKNLAVVAVDEAHCNWLGSNPTTQDETAIVTSLHLNKPVIVTQQLDRPNMTASMGMKVSLYAVGYVAMSLVMVHPCLSREIWGN